MLVMMDIIETFLIIQFTICVFGLKNVNIVIEPPIVEKGNSVTIQCNYDLEGELLYIVKWYRGQREFYRYVPQSRPTTMKFPFNGLDIDEDQSNENRVHLRNVDYNLAGNFSCEVSTDAPAFYTNIVSKELKVVELSKNKRLPVLVTDKPKYEEGDVLNASCSSSPSNPAASIYFILNNIVICGPCNTTIYKKEGLWLARSNLLLPLFPSHFNTDNLILRCVTHVTDRYQQEIEIQIYNRPYPIPQRVISSGAILTNGKLLLSCLTLSIFVCFYK
ncbi:uncharacterized protein LOC108737623 [Agrilus planipennis]|uniref:Uncharacterized protein LOC108737623 n=1 Tax=Agrilus planipennis TaxID=224129 RepID=A0A1W4X101_AGRPL|nr:uncharacterized protein LOC108737623 [Agrilus planipennis]